MFKGERLTVQFARGPRHRDNFSGPGPERPSIPRPRRTIYRMQMSGLPETSWQVSLNPLHPRKAFLEKGSCFGSLEHTPRLRVPTTCPSPSVLSSVNGGP
jgi:hypothetical protein